MVFANACIASPRPIAYVVDKFFEGSARLNDYPDPTRYAFARTFVANLTLMRITRGQKRLGGTQDLLLSFDMPSSLADVPSILEFGDLVLGFAHVPPYRVEDKLYLDGSDASLGHVHALTEAMNALEERFRQAALSRWLLLARDGDRPPNFSVGDVSRADAGRSRWVAFPHAIKLKKGGQANTYFAWRLGLIDVAFPAAEAIPEIWQKEKERQQAMAVLQQSDFGPKGIWQLAREDYQESVGRGLAYNLLHELWHAAQETHLHPYALGNQVIENDDGTKPLPGIQYQPHVVKAIEDRYKTGWCKCITDKRVSLARLNR
jgi:hypothetical protein